MEINSCIIVGAGEFEGFRKGFTADYIIAADGGYNHVQKADLIVGDNDSLVGNVGGNVEVVQFSAEKDESDMELAVNEAIKRGFSQFFIYGALGKRFDHSLANVAVLASISRKGMRAWLVSENAIITAITDSKIEIEPNVRVSDNISVFAFGETANGVTIKGLKYTLDNAALRCDSTQGLSNEFVGDLCGEIEVRDGTVVVVLAGG